MSENSSLSERLSRALATPANGVLGLVDELLAAACEREVRLDWRDGRGRLELRTDAGPSDPIEVPVPKAVVRAALARVAALCNERIPNSVSPYGGSGEVDAGPAQLIRVRFVNTPDEQRLELAPLPADTAPPADGQTPAVPIAKNEPLPSDDVIH